MNERTFDLARTVPIAHKDSDMVRAPAHSAMGHVTPEEFELLGTNGA